MIAYILKNVKIFTIITFIMKLELEWLGFYGVGSEEDDCFKLMIIKKFPKDIFNKTK